MAKRPNTTAVTDPMIRAGIAALARGRDLPIGERVTAVYLAMAEAVPMIPVDRTTFVKDDKHGQLLIGKPVKKAAKKKAKSR